jgi:hypothetical protein
MLQAVPCVRRRRCRAHGISFVLCYIEPLVAAPITEKESLLAIFDIAYLFPNRLKGK